MLLHTTSVVWYLMMMLPHGTGVIGLPVELAMFFSIFCSMSLKSLSFSWDLVKHITLLDAHSDDSKAYYFYFTLSLEITYVANQQPLLQK